MLLMFSFLLLCLLFFLVFFCSTFPSKFALAPSSRDRLETSVRIPIFLGRSYMVRKLEPFDISAGNPCLWETLRRLAAITVTAIYTVSQKGCHLKHGYNFVISWSISFTGAKSTKFPAKPILGYLLTVEQRLSNVCTKHANFLSDFR